MVGGVSDGVVFFVVVGEKVVGGGCLWAASRHDTVITHFTHTQPPGPSGKLSRLSPV